MDGDGLVANTAGTNWGIHPSVFHGIIAFAILILSPWKQAIVRRGLGRRKKTPWISILLLLLVLSTLTTGIMHAFGYQGRIGPLTLMQVHIGGALFALVLAYFHYRSIDVSTVKELCRRWYPKVYEAAPSKAGHHRALDDIRESVAELAYYREHFFLDGSAPA